MDGECHGADGAAQWLPSQPWPRLAVQRCLLAYHSRLPQPLFVSAQRRKMHTFTIDLESCKDAKCG